MFAIISYTIHATTSAVLSILLLFHNSEVQPYSKYHFFLKGFVAIFLLNIMTDCVFVYYATNDIPMGFTYLFHIPFATFLEVSTILFMYHLRLHTPARFHTKQNYLFIAILTLSTLHPLLYSDYCIMHNVVASVHSYRDYCNTDICKYSCKILQCTYILFILYGIYNAITSALFLHKYYKSYARQLKTNRVVIICLILVILTFSILVDCMFLKSAPYHKDLLLWTIFMVIATVAEMNCKKDFLRMENEARLINFNYALQQTSKKDVSNEQRDKYNIQKREWAIAKRVMEDWIKSKERDYIQSDFTILDLSVQTRLPIGLIAQYINTTYGVHFDEFVSIIRLQREAKNAAKNT